MTLPTARLDRLRRRLVSYRRRRIDIPVGREALVLDVGSGDKPHWRADVLLDRYVGAEHAGQRSGSRSARVTLPLFDADAAAMPFADGVFDYVICSHVLEHVPDPGAVIAEIQRVGRAGYIEVPDAASARIVDFPSHLWWCSSEGGALIFTAKTEPFFDAGIDGYLTASGNRERLARLLDADLDSRVVSLRWSGSVPFEVRGTLDPTFVAEVTAAGAHHRGGQAFASRVLTAATRIALRSRRRRGAIRLDDIVRPGLRRGSGGALIRKVYVCGNEPDIAGGDA